MSYFYDGDETNGLRNYGLSLAVHVAIVVAATVFSVPLEPLDEGTIEIDYIGVGAVSQGVQTSVAKTVAKSPKVERPSAVEEVITPAEEESAAPPELPELDEPVAVSEPVEEPDSLDSFAPVADLDVPGQIEDVSLEDFVDAGVDDIESELEAADQLLEDEIQAENEQLAREAQEAVALENELRAQQKRAAQKIAEAKAAAERRAQAKRLKELREEEARKRAAQARAAEAAKQKAAKLRAAQRAAEASRLQAQRAAQKAARLAAQKAAQKGRTKKPGAQAQYGTPTGVRDLEDLKQFPGNPRPEYSATDRYDRKEGLVVFQAYVTKNGTLTRFRLKRSSGHKSLDIRTLGALKKWKFYPGQEGWVELPFKWNLKGDVQEFPSGLRRKLGRN